MFTKIGSLLGTLAFAWMLAIGIHQKVEVDAINAHQPPPLTTLQQSVVKVESAGAICSGWVLKNSTKVITAAHCFEDSMTNGPVNAQITFSDGKQVPYQVTKMGDASTEVNDIAVLSPVEGVLKQGPEGLEVCKTPLYVGEPIVMMGNPLDVTKMVSWGYVASPSYKQDDPASPMSILNGTILLDIQMYQGNSGGPVMDANTGCVLGSAELIVPISLQGYAVPTGIAFAAPIPKDI